MNISKFRLLLIPLSALVGCSRDIKEKSKDASQEGPATLNELVWKFKTSGEIVSSPAVSANMAYVGSEDGNLYAVSTKDGLERWRFETQPGTFPKLFCSGKGAFSPFISNKIILFGACDGYFHAVDSQTGKENWRFKTEGFIKALPNVIEGVAYIGSEDGFLYAINIKTGQEVWKFKTNGWIRSKPAIWNDRVYFTSYDSSVYSLSLKTGNEIWRIKTKGKTSDPIISGGIVYFGCYDENGTSLNGVDAASGADKWRITPAFLVKYPVCVQDGIIYFATGTSIYAVDIESKRERWSFEAQNNINSAPTISGQTLYFGSLDQRVYAINIKTGQEKWRFQSEDRVLSSPVVSGGAVYFGSTDNNLYMLK
jgi:outer membrane protein assembly factor BamB